LAIKVNAVFAAKDHPLSYDRAMDNETSQAFRQLHERFAGIETEVAKIAGIETEVAKIAGIETEVAKIAGMDARLSRLQGDFQDLTVMLIDEFRRIDRRFEEMSEKLGEELRRHAGILLEEQKSYFSVFNEKLRDHDEQLQDHQERLESIEKKIA
jgi:hypothetical protein